MIRHILLDAGPLAAFVTRQDRHHAWAREQFADILPPLLTCEAVISEACFLSRKASNGAAAILGLIDRGVVKIEFAFKDHFEQVSTLMATYESVPMSLADGCLVRMSELVADCAVFTLDSDFRIYRRHRRQTIPLICPNE